MPCTPFAIVDESGAVTGRIVCTRGRRRRPCACGRTSSLLCDGPRPSRRSGTCDAPICTSCATTIGPDQHLCRACVAAPSAQLALFGGEP